MPKSPLVVMSFLCPEVHLDSRTADDQALGGLLNRWWDGWMGATPVAFTDSPVPIIP